MIYDVTFTKKFNKKFSKLDKQTQKIIKSWIDKNLINCTNPRLYGKPLTGNLTGQWRYRIGNYRIFAEIEDKEIVLILLDIGHRKEIYKR